MRPNEFEVSAEFASLLIYFAKSSAETAWQSATDMLLMFKNTSCWNSFKLVKFLRIINTHKAMPSLRTIGATRPSGFNQRLGNSPAEASDWPGPVEVAPGTSAKAPGLKWALHGGFLKRGRGTHFNGMIR